MSQVPNRNDKILICDDHNEARGPRIQVASKLEAIRMSPYSPTMFFDADVADDDVKTEHGGVQVVIDPASIEHLGGAELDYRDGLQGSGFHVSNPNAQRTCGCGQSFS